MIRITRAGSRAAEITWDPEDDRRGWLAAALDGQHLQYGLGALADPALFTEAADEGRARAQLSATAWLITQLARRQDALVVALKDRGKTSWAELVRLVDPDEPDPQSKRSAMQRRYEAGRRRAGLSTDATEVE